MLFEIARSIVSTSGAITDRLREDWGLINVMKELNLPKYKALGLTEVQERKFGEKVEVISDWTKRNDHRHHAMDALTIAFTKHNHIQYLNYLNARKNENHKLHGNIIAIETKETEMVVDETGNKKRKFKLPVPNFRQVAKEHLENVLVSHKAKNKVVTKNKNKIKTKNGDMIKVELTPRGQLHKETVYGKYHYYDSKEEKIGAKFDEEAILKVANPMYRKLLLQRLSENGNDPKKAFAGKNVLSKNPIYLDENKKEALPEKVKLVWLEEYYSIRKDVTPDNFKDLKTIEKILDVGVKKALKRRLNDFDGDPKKAFSDLGKNPIWLNEEKGISIMRVTISGVKNAEPLHYKKDHHGNFILDDEGHKIPVDFVSTGNNHHVAIYKDENGDLFDYAVSFSDVVKRINFGLPIVPKNTNELWDEVLKLGIDNQPFLETLPRQGLNLNFSMKQNEYFVFPNEKTDFDPNKIDLLDQKNRKLISPNLFRVQKIAFKDYFFRHHLETNVENNSKTKNVTWRREGLSGINGMVKVRINHIGDIVKIGE